MFLDLIERVIYLQDQPEENHKDRKPRLMTTEDIDSDYDSMEDK